METETWRDEEIETWRNGTIKGKTENAKTEAQLIFLNLFLFAHRANGRLSFIRLLTKQQTD
jgi:hypothetical protein